MTRDILSISFFFFLSLIAGAIFLYNALRAMKKAPKTRMVVLCCIIASMVILAYVSKQPICLVALAFFIIAAITDVDTRKNEKEIERIMQKEIFDIPKIKRDIEKGKVQVIEVPYVNC